MKTNLDDRFRRYYRDLLRCAAAALRRDPGASLSPATLVHEAWLRLVKASGVADVSTQHFKAIAARQLRRILVDAARRRHAIRRGGPGHFTVSFDEPFAATPSTEEQVVDLDRALSALGKLKSRLEDVAELHFFAGCTGSEIATALNVSESAVDRDLRFIRDWLDRRFASERAQRRP